MRIFRLFTSFLILSAVFASLLPLTAPRAAAAEELDIDAASAVLAEASTGEVLYAKNENEKTAPAGLAKIMTALLAAEAYDRGDAALTDTVTVTEAAYSGLGADSGQQALKVGEEVTFRDLMYCILLASQDEACNAMAVYLSGSTEDFVALMNARASELGCRSTNFTNTHGQPDDSQYTTAGDLCLIAAQALKSPLFADISKTASYSMPATNLSAVRKLTAANKLLIENNKYYYKYASGIKNGYADSAGYCLAASAEKDGVSLVSVVLGGKSVKDTDGSTLVKSYSETKRLLDWGFANFGYRTILDTASLIREVPVAMGDGADSVVLRPMTSVTAFLDSEIKDSDFTYDVKLYTDGEGFVAPVKAGDILGEITVYLDGRVFGTSKLVANTGVPLSRVVYMQSEIAKFFALPLVRVIVTVFILILALYVVFVIRYNSRRRKKREAERAEAEKRRAEAARGRKTTIGKSFEDIEDMHKQKNDSYRHKH